jgi:long-chain fatty acid transport protein
VSFFSKLDNRWDVMGDVQFTQWSTIQNLKFTRTTGAVLSSTPENFKNAWRYSLGVSYHQDDQWTFRGGFAYDQTPTNSVDLTPRLPDGNRTWATIGAQYKFSPQLAVDAGFAYIWISDPSINQNAGSTTANGLINGNYNSNVTILSAQLTWSF